MYICTLNFLNESKRNDFDIAIAKLFEKEACQSHEEYSHYG